LSVLYLFSIFIGINDICAQKKGIDSLYSAFISVSPETMKILQSARTAQFVKNTSISLENYEILTKKTLNYLENTGFPFASIFLDEILEKNDTVFAQLVLNKNIRCTFDTIVVRGNLKIAKSYLKGYFNFKNKNSYNESVVRLIPQLAIELPFAVETQPATVEFTEENASLYLFLEKRRVNQFDGYIGIAPVSSQTGRIAVSGELNLRLLNLFTIGENIDLQWRATEQFSQFLELKTIFPYLFGTPLGIDGVFLLDKKDTTFLNMNYIIGLNYSFRGHNYTRVYLDYSTSNLLNNSLYTLSHSQSILDYKKTMYGFAFRFRQLDFIYNPRKGYELTLNCAVGNRKIIENGKAGENFYSEVEINSVRYRLQGKIRGYIPLHSRWVAVLGAEGGALYGKNPLVNEMFRIGGINSLQGFEDLSIRASSYGIGLVEMRFIMAKIAYLNTFFNGAWYEQKINDNYRNDFPFGFGTGITFTTKAGLFYLSYALGKQLDNPISFKTGKIHFGLAVQF
jgi:outer membrane protein assembly factor BamA